MLPLSKKGLLPCFSCWDVNMGLPSSCTHPLSGQHFISLRTAFST